MYHLTIGNKQSPDSLSVKRQFYGRINLYEVFCRRNGQYKSLYCSSKNKMWQLRYWFIGICRSKSIEIYKQHPSLHQTFYKLQFVSPFMNLRALMYTTILCPDWPLLSYWIKLSSKYPWLLKASILSWTN